MHVLYSKYTLTLIQTLRHVMNCTVAYRQFCTLTHTQVDVVASTFTALLLRPGHSQPPRDPFAWKCCCCTASCYWSYYDMKHCRLSGAISSLSFCFIRAYTNSDSSSTYVQCRSPTKTIRVYNLHIQQLLVSLADCKSPRRSPTSFFLAPPFLKNGSTTAWIVRSLSWFRSVGLSVYC